MADLTFACVAACFNYDSETGEFLWKERPLDHFKGSNAEMFQLRFNKCVAGKKAFTSINNKGYARCKIFGRAISGHRAAWLLHYGTWPALLIDHINGIKTDNRISNLRHVDIVVNGRNRRMNVNNSSGVTGVHWHQGMRKWIANVGLEGKLIHLGYFSDMDSAIIARKSADKVLAFSSRNESKTA